jgi:hypothetical protein
MEAAYAVELAAPVQLVPSRRTTVEAGYQELCSSTENSGTYVAKTIIRISAISAIEMGMA